MNDDYIRPDPDKLLAQIRSEEGATHRGKLKIFLGYAAGVGKTYAMLEAAHQRSEEGVDVVVGFVETHGRKETETLLSGLEIIQRKQFDYRGINISEMDLDAVLARHPQLVLVDELAHTNAPGSRHPKRYQDVEEILDAGIDVYSTVNIQHLESLFDIVQQITGVIVREKIPDRIVDEADEIELIDLPTDELLTRLRDGKVYISDQAMRALEKFFRKGNLTALRELSMRRAADRVDNQMLHYMQDKSIPGPWPATERILVCISSHPMGERLIRSGRRLADTMSADWAVLFVETPQHLHMAQENQIRVQRFFETAEKLGAKVVKISAESVAETVIQYARNNNITKIIAGKPLRSPWFTLFRKSVIDQIIRRSGPIDVYVVSDVNTPYESTIYKRRKPFFQPLWHYAVSILLVAAATFIGYLFGPSLESFNLVMIYLMAVVISAIYLNRGPAILTSVAGVLAFNFFFIKPIFTFTVYDSQYLLTFMALVMVGIIISNFAVLLRDQVVAIRGKENQTQSLLNLSRELNAAISLDQVLNIAIRSSRILLNRECVILLPQNGGLINKMAAKEVVSDADDLAVAEWAFNHAQPAGSGTETLPESPVRFVPLRAAHGPVGVLGIRFDEKDKLLKNDQRIQLEGFVNLIALAVERANFVDAATRQEMMKNTEKLQTALLNSISHELRTPLASITGVLTTLSESEKAKQELNKLDPATRIELLESATDQARQLNRLVENLLNTTRLEAGSVHLDLEYCDMEDLIGAVLQQFKTRLDNHPMKLEIPGHLPLITCDPVLISQVINNLLDNACKYSPPGSSITIGAVSKPGAIEVFIRNSGSVLAEDELEKIFSKFYRSSRHNKTTGTGLGLSICKGIVEAHGGWIKAYYDQEHNLTFCFSLPVNLQKEPTHE